ncbi:hypothetical protein K3495_g16736, partial [Podosphaera aphanis]
MEFDIDGYRKTLYAYIIPHLSHEMILGKPWMEREDVVYHAKRHCMDIREAIINGQPLRVWEKGLKTRYQEVEGMGTVHPNFNISGLSAGVFLATVRRVRRSTSGKSTQLFAVSLADIQKALAPSKKSTTSLERLPAQYKDFSDLFKKKLTDELPPHRLGCDHEIKLEPDKEIPWG